MHRRSVWLRAFLAPVLVVALFGVAAAPRAGAADGAGMGYVSHLATGAATNSVDVAGNYAYVTAPARTRISTPELVQDTDLRVIDVSDPARAREVGSFAFGAGGGKVRVQGSYAYVLVTGGLADPSRLLVVDVSDPARPRQVGATNVSTVFTGFASDLDVQGALVYVVSGPSPSFRMNSFDVVNVFDPARPTVVGTLRWSDNGGSLTGVRVVGTTAYVADERVGLRIVSVADPSRPTQVGQYTPPIGLSTDVAVRGCCFAFLGTSAIGTSGSTPGVRAIDVFDPTRPREVGAIALPSAPLDLRLFAANLHVADGRGGVRVVDVSDASALRETGASTAAENAAEVAFAGATATGATVYAADFDGALWILRYPMAGSSALSPRAYLTLAPQNSALPGVAGVFVSSVTVQNLGGSTASVAVQIVAPDGAPVGAAIRAQVGPGQNHLVYLPNAADVPAGRYAAVVSSDRPVRAQANLLAQEPAMAMAYTGVRPTGAGLTVHLPGVFRGYFGYGSAVAVQNSSPTAAHVTVTYRDQAGAAVGSSGPLTVPPNGVVDTGPASAGVREGFVGGASVASDVPVLATAQVANAAGEFGGAAGTAAYPTFPFRAYLTANLPVVYKNYSSDGWVSSILVQNVGTDPEGITLTFRGAGLAAPVVLIDTLAAGASKLYYQGTQAELPDGFVGSAVVEQTSGSGGIVAVVNARNARGNLASYTGFLGAEASTGVVSVPALYNDYSPLHFSSSLLVQNVRYGANPIEITYFDQSGAVKTITETLGPFETRLHYQPNEGLPVGFHGSARVRSLLPLGGEIVGVANVLSVGQTSGDWLFTYEGFNAPP